MSALRSYRANVSVQRYLAQEELSPSKHEYIGGAVHAMAGARAVHNIISGNLLVAFHNRLRGKPCRPFNSDMKVRVKLRDQLRFYYPDMQVTCQPTPLDDSYLDHPSIIIEVLSASTRRIDEEEKKDAYLTIPSLETYLLVDSSNKVVVVYQRDEDQGFLCSEYLGADAVIPIPCLGFDLPLSEVYDGLTLPALEVVSDGQSA